MTTRTRMNVYFDPDLLKQVDMLALRRNVSKSAIVEAAVASFLSGDAADRLEAAMSRRLDRLGRQMDGLDEDLAVLGETLSLFVQFWLTITPPSIGARIGASPTTSINCEKTLAEPTASHLSLTTAREITMPAHPPRAWTKRAPISHSRDGA